MKIDVVTTRAVDTGAYIVQARVEDVMTAALPELLFREVVSRIAERYVADNYQQIAALISQDAIATLSVAEAAAKVRASLENEIPDRVREVERVKREVYQRGIFGGLKRIE